MSDCFDHMSDAWDQHLQYEHEFDDDQSGSSNYSNYDGYEDYEYDKLYYHRKHKFRSIEAQTDKAYLFNLKNGKQQWVPKSLCKKLKIKHNHVRVYIWHKFKFSD